MSHITFTFLFFYHPTWTANAFFLGCPIVCTSFVHPVCLYICLVRYCYCDVS